MPPTPENKCKITISAARASVEREDSNAKVEPQRYQQPIISSQKGDKMGAETTQGS